MVRIVRSSASEYSSEKKCCWNHQQQFFSELPSPGRSHCELLILLISNHLLYNRFYGLLLSWNNPSSLLTFYRLQVSYHILSKQSSVLTTNSQKPFFFPKFTYLSLNDAQKQLQIKMAILADNRNHNIIIEVSRH